MFDRKFTKSLIIHDFDDVLKNPFRYVDLFLLHTLINVNLDPLLQVMHGDFRKKFLIIMCAIGKDAHI